MRDVNKKTQKWLMVTVMAMNIHMNHISLILISVINLNNQWKFQSEVLRISLSNLRIN